MKMKKNLHIFLLFSLPVLLSSCAPVLDRSSLREGERSVSFKALRDNPSEHKDRLYVFGGVIVKTKLTAEGSEVEAMHVPVDRYGYFEARGRSEGRFIAVMPADWGLMDPEIFTRGRKITIAGRFTGVKKDKIGEMEYVYPVFEIADFYFWPRETDYYPGYYYSPWFYQHPYYYPDPWWSYPRYNFYFDYYYWGRPPLHHRPPPPPSQPPPPPRPPSLQRPERPGP